MKIKKLIIDTKGLLIAVVALISIKNILSILNIRYFILDIVLTIFFIAVFLLSLVSLIPFLSQKPDDTKLSGRTREVLIILFILLISSVLGFLIY